MRTGRSTHANCLRWSTSSAAAPIWPSGAAARSTGCGGRGTRGWAPRRCAGGCAPRGATDTGCDRPPIRLPAGTARASGSSGVARRRTRRRVRSAHRRQVEGQRLGPWEFHCGAGLLAGDLMIPVVVLVVAKAPVPGQAKTRLAAGVGDQAAAEIAAAALLDTLDAVAAAPVAER